MNIHLTSIFINSIVVFIAVNIVQKFIFLKTSNPNTSEVFSSAFLLLTVVYVVNYFLHKKNFSKKSVLITLVLVPIAILMDGLYFFYRLELNANLLFSSNQQDYFLFNCFVIAIAFVLSVFVAIIYAIINFVTNKKNN